MQLNITEKEKEILNKILGIAVYNANHMDIQAFDIKPKEYKIVCQLFNKLQENQ